jgi:hypothetical protein
MSDEHQEPERDSKDEDALRALLKRSATPAAPEGKRPEKQADILRGVQRKIRLRSRGKFYADGWSTSEGKLSYILVALIMLLVVAVAFFALGPIGISAR